MNKTLAVAIILAAAWISGYSSMHDRKGWDQEIPKHIRMNNPIF